MIDAIVYGIVGGLIGSIVINVLLYSRSKNSSGYQPHEINQGNIKPPRGGTGEIRGPKGKK
jgi:hypothetical protein